jgi:NAD(P)-dependent dehydrogenase (short-subunit alcohol dehydrogenase family)
MGGVCSSYDKPAEVKSKVFPALKASLPRMDGKVVAVTGCTTGTGYILAKTCAELGAHVVMLNRASGRADAALAAIQNEVPGSKVTGIPCDLMSFESVRETTAQLKRDFADTGLDVLCNNAGIMASKDEATKDGCDTQMQTNHLSHFLLTAEVWPLLEQAASKNGEARLVNHSSMARNTPYGPLEAKYLGKNGGKLGGDQPTNCCNPLSNPRWKRYQQTKLANVVFTYALDDKIQAKGSKVKALVAHPGLAATNLQVTTTQEGGMGSGLTNMLMSQSQSAEDGTAGIVMCCCARDVASRQFYGPKAATGAAEVLKEDGKHAAQEYRDLLWSESQKTTGVTFTL